MNWRHLEGHRFPVRRCRNGIDLERNPRGDSARRNRYIARRKLARGFSRGAFCRCPARAPVRAVRARAPPPTSICCSTFTRYSPTSPTARRSLPGGSEEGHQLLRAVDQLAGFVEREGLEAQRVARQCGRRVAGQDAQLVVGELSDAEDDEVGFAGVPFGGGESQRTALGDRARPRLLGSTSVQRGMVCRAGFDRPSLVCPPQHPRLRLGQQSSLTRRFAARTGAFGPRARPSDEPEVLERAAVRRAISKPSLET